MPVSGDFDRLARLIAALDAADRALVGPELSGVLGATALKLTMDGFAASRDPYGRPWAALKFRDGKPLLDTGRMRAATYFKVVSHGFQIGIAVNYASTHQYGATIVPRNGRFLVFPGKDGRPIFARKVVVPQRQMLPMPETGGLGPIWSGAMARDAETFLVRKFGAMVGA